MKRTQRITASVLCANKIMTGRDIRAVRVAVLVKRGKDVERVVILDVERQPEGFAQPRTSAAIIGVAKDVASFPNMPQRGVRIVGAAFDGDAFTGLGQPEAAYMDVTR